MRSSTSPSCCCSGTSATKRRPSQPRRREVWGGVSSLCAAEAACAAAASAPAPPVSRTASLLLLLGDDAAACQPSTCSASRCCRVHHEPSRARVWLCARQPVGAAAGSAPVPRLRPRGSLARWGGHAHGRRSRCCCHRRSCGRLHRRCRCCLRAMPSRTEDDVLLRVGRSASGFSAAVLARRPPAMFAGPSAGQTAAARDGARRGRCRWHSTGAVWPPSAREQRSAASEGAASSPPRRPLRRPPLPPRREQRCTSHRRPLSLLRSRPRTSPRRSINECSELYVCLNSYCNYCIVCSRKLVSHPVEACRSSRPFFAACLGGLAPRPTHRQTCGALRICAHCALSIACPTPFPFLDKSTIHRCSSSTRSRAARLA